MRRLIEAATYFDHQLPEVFAGFPRAETPFPIAYPTAARPQAWAAATPVLLLQVLLGLRPDHNRQARDGRAGGVAFLGGRAQTLGRARIRRGAGTSSRGRAVQVEET